MAYRSNGSAAYDIHYNSAAQPLQQPERLPDAPAQRQPVRKVKARLAVSPFAILGPAVAMVLLFLVVFSYVRMYEAKSLTGELSKELTAQSERNERLKAQFEDKLDLDQVKERALELGMRQPTSSQIVYIHVDTGDTTQVFSAKKERNFAQSVFDAFRSLFTDALEYFS